MADCLLSKLGSPLIRAPLPGLIVHPQGIELLKRHLTCCGGTGLMHDSTKDVSHFCSLSKRLALVADLAKQAAFKSVGEKSILNLAASTPVAQEVTNQLTALSAKKDERGVATLAGTLQGSFAVGYAIALAAVWRFDLRSSVVELGDIESVDRFVLSLTQANGRQPELVVVTGIGRLFETQRLEHLEIVIGAAYRGRLPLFACIEPTTRKAAIPQATAGFRQSSVKDRLKQLKEKHPFDFLSIAMRQQLAAVCRGTNTQEKDKAKTGRRVGPLSPEL